MRAYRLEMKLKAQKYDRQRLRRKKADENKEFVKIGDQVEREAQVCEKLLNKTSKEIPEEYLYPIRLALKSPSNRPTVAARHFVSGKTGLEYKTVKIYHQKYSALRGRAQC